MGRQWKAQLKILVLLSTVNDDSFTTLVRQANDVPDETLHDIVIQTDERFDQAAQSNSQTGEHGHHSSMFSLDYTSNKSDRTLLFVGDKVEVFRPDLDHYHAGTVDEADKNARQIRSD